MRDRQWVHDTIQANRRTKKQNEAIIRLITGEGGPSALWGYSDIPEEGGDVKLYNVHVGKTWEISKTGKVTELDDDSPPITEAGLPESVASEA